MSGNFRQEGPQSPAVEKNGDAAASGTVYEVYSVNEQGVVKRHQICKTRGEAFDKTAKLKKLFGSDIKVSVREVRDARGNLMQTVKKCMALVSPMKIEKQQGDGGMQKSFNRVVSDCRDLITKAKKVGGGASPTVIGHTTSGKAIHHEGNKGHHARGWSAQDHLDAFHKHHDEAVEHRMAMSRHPLFQTVRNSDPHYHLTPEQTMARVSQHRGDKDADTVLHHEKTSDHHHAIAEAHYQAYKKKSK